MGTLHLKFYTCLRLRFLDVEDPRRPVVASCRILCSNVWGLSWSLSDLAVASSQYDILLCSLTLVSELRHVSELLVVPRQAASCPWDGGICYEMDMEHFDQPKFECGCCKMLVVRVCGLRQNFYAYSLYRNPDQDDRIYDC